VLRKLLARERTAANPGLLIKIWRELMADSLARQGPFHLSVWGPRPPAPSSWPACASAPPRPCTAAPRPRTPWPPPSPRRRRRPGPGLRHPWWGRLLADALAQVFAALPCLAAWGPTGALAVAEVEVEPTGGDETFWVTDAPAAAAIIEALGRDGVAAEPAGRGRRAEAVLAWPASTWTGDERLAARPGSLTGVIGAAPAPFDV
jgi:hypothetical protein